MARTAKTNPTTEGVIKEVTDTTEKVTEKKEEVKTSVAPVEKPKIIIASISTPFRRTPSLEAKYIVGQMPTGTAFEITNEVTSKIFGDFYLLNNGYYVTKNGHYSIS